MYSQNELNEAVAAGALSATEADAFRRFVEDRRQMPLVDEENFRLLTSFNDIFVTIAIIITMVAVVGLTGPASPFVALAVAFGLSEVFVRRRRMALPAIALVIVVAMAGSWIGLLILEKPWAASMLALAAAGAHWWRYRVPITPAIIMATIGSLLIAVLADPSEQQGSFAGFADYMTGTLLPLWLAWGVLTFVVAMWWDMRDPARVTRDSDVAFWLHLSSSPMIIHSAFWTSGLAQATLETRGAVILLIVYALIGLVALAIDRRAMLVSALAYALFAFGRLAVTQADWSIAIPATALAIGSLLLLMGAFWHRLRRLVVAPLPAGLRRFLPNLDRVPIPQPAA